MICKIYIHSPITVNIPLLLTARDVWKKKYFEEKKKTPPVEEQANKLRQELDQLHRKIMSSLEGNKDKSGRGMGNVEPSQQVC